MPAKVTIAAYRCNTGGTQITLSQTDEEGRGWGRRLAGPKHHNLGTKELVSEELEESDAREIRRMLDAAFPLTVYRVDCHGITAAIYFSQKRARAHCISEATSTGSPEEGLNWWRRTDDGAGPALLCESSGRPTGYSVTAMAVASDYDPDAEG